MFQLFRGPMLFASNKGFSLVISGANRCYRQLSAHNESLCCLLYSLTGRTASLLTLDRGPPIPGPDLRRTLDDPITAVRWVGEVTMSPMNRISTHYSVSHENWPKLDIPDSISAVPPRGRKSTARKPKKRGKSRGLPDIFCQVGCRHCE